MRKTILWVAVALALIAIPAAIGLVALRGDDSSSSARRAAALVQAGGPEAYQLQLTPGTGTAEGIGKDAIEVESFSWGAENGTTIGSATGGAAAGKIKFNELKISKKVDKASPVLFKVCASGGHYQTAMLTLRKAGEKTPYMTFTMKTVFITDVDYGGGSPAMATEEVTIVFGELNVEVVDRNPDGTLAQPVQAGWNQILNVAR